MSFPPTFEDLSPDVIVSSVEKFLELRLDGVITPYNSYVNRVYGLQDGVGGRFIVKFYRPGRWSREGILEEHRFLFQCGEREIPVIPPLVSRAETSLGEACGILFAVFPLRGGRTFDIGTKDDWIRLGSIVGRMHQVGRMEPAKERVLCSPVATTSVEVEDLIGKNYVPEACLDDFRSVCQDTLELISPLFEGIKMQRIHGDCHRGNILDRLDEGLLIIDFDDMMTGPAVQDLWLLLPGHLAECGEEMDLILEGYRGFAEFEHENLRLVEPLRFMRIIYFLSWCALQKDDLAFLRNFPDWGTKAFWIKEVEDLRYQLNMIKESFR